MAGSALVSGYGRDMELEADGLGAQYLDRMGYDPDAMIDVVRLLKNQEAFEIQQARAENRKPRIYHGVFSTHPDNDTRLHEVIKAAHKVDANAGTPPDGRDVYLSHIKGLPFGSSAAQGMVRGSRFYHADMGFTVAFPTAWTVSNTPSKVLAYPAAKDAFLELFAMPVPPNVGPREFLTGNLKGTTLSSAEALQANGLQGYTAIASGVTLPWGARGPARYTVVYLNNMAYVFRGATRLASALTATDPLFMSSIRTFRRLKDSEFALAEPTRLELVKATPQTRIEALARTSPVHPYPAEQLRLLNDLYPDKEPVAGQTLKVVD
jgi:predicted Zn-dependent protease